MTLIALTFLIGWKYAIKRQYIWCNGITRTRQFSLMWAISKERRKGPTSFVPHLKMFPTPQTANERMWGKFDDTSRPSSGKCVYFVKKMAYSTDGMTNTSVEISSFMKHPEILSKSLARIPLWVAGCPESTIWLQPRPNLPYEMLFNYSKKEQFNSDKYPPTVDRTTNTKICIRFA